MSQSNIVIFDFDGTLYDGNSFHDFMIFIAMRFLKTLKLKAIMLLLYYVLLRFVKKFNHIEMKVKIISLSKKYITENELQEFTEIMQKRLNPKIMTRLDSLVKSKTVIVSSAAPCVYLKQLKRIDHVDIIHCSDSVEGIWLENKSKHKLKRIESLFPNLTIEELYTDHHDDLDLAWKSEKVYLVTPSKETVRLFKPLEDKTEYFLE